jgi:hypothetical protein
MKIKLGNWLELKIGCVEFCLLIFVIAAGFTNVPIEKLMSGLGLIQLMRRQVIGRTEKPSK